MLKAYDYVEYTPKSFSSMEARHFSQELDLACEAVKNSIVDGRESVAVPKCMCGYNETVIFFTKWGVDYYRCPKCGTISAAADINEVLAYKKNEKLIDLRISKDYQEEAATRRDTIWEELIDWIVFRSFRYLGKKNLNIIDYGNRYDKLAEKIIEREMCKGYEMRNTIINAESHKKLFSEPADIVLYINNLQQSMSPVEDLKLAGENLRDGGLMFLSTRIGTGFDIVTLKEHSKIFPFEHTFLPSMKTLKSVLNSAGYRVLEVSTPGSMDAIFVAKNRDKVGVENDFVRFLLEQESPSVLQEFQRFLQKNGMSSYAQLVVQKDGDFCG